MSSGTDLVIERMEKDLAGAVERAADIITNSYLEKLERYKIADPTFDKNDTDLAKCGTFYKLSKLVLSKEESFLDKLATIVNTAYSMKGSIVNFIISDGARIDYYLGIVSKEHRTEGDTERRQADADAFFGALSGNLIGSEFEHVSEDLAEKLTQEMFDTEKINKSVAAISGIVAPRNKENSAEKFVQGIENLVDSLRGRKYTIMFLADPVDKSELQRVKRGYELLYTQLSSFRAPAVTISSDDTAAISKARTDGVTTGISTGVSATQSVTSTKGSSHSFNASIVVLGYSYSKHKDESKTRGRTDTYTELKQQNVSITDTTSSTRGEGKSLQVNYENRTIKALLDKLDKHIERLDLCESLGAFNCAAYCIADNEVEALTVASNYNALMRGDDSSVQSSHINIWSKEKARDIQKYLIHAYHPVLRDEKDEELFLTPASIISGRELAIQIGLPKKSVNGVTVVQMAAFGRNVKQPVDPVSIGRLYHMGRPDGGDVRLDRESLAMHTFITGSTGSGKSNVVYKMLSELTEHDKAKFLVIEPAKGEYKDVFGGREDTEVYGTNPKKTKLLKINPFSFPDDVHVLEHIDRLVELFNACWPMYAAMPAVLKDAIERAYISCGWDMQRSYNKYNLYPSFSDVLHQIGEVINATQYSADSKGDYIGALSTRLRSLSVGINGMIFTADEIAPEDLFDKNVIADLSRVGSVETKALIMGILIIKLQEYRMSTAIGTNSALKHITVIEEAHALLRRTSTEQVSESSNLTGKSVELLANAIAEMRTFGEGFVIADQSPGLLDISVIRNTNTKIILRLPDLADRELVGKAAALKDDQIDELAKLPLGVAAVYQNDWIEPVLCQIARFDNKLAYTYSESDNKRSDCDLTAEIKNIIINHRLNFYDESEFKELLLGDHKIDTALKRVILEYFDMDVKNRNEKLSEMAYLFFNSDEIINALDKGDNMADGEAAALSIMTPDMSDYSQLELQSVLWLIVYGANVRNARYAELYSKYVEYVTDQRGVK